MLYPHKMLALLSLVYLPSIVNPNPRFNEWSSRFSSISCRN